MDALKTLVESTGPKADLVVDCFCLRPLPLEGRLSPVPRELVLSATGVFDVVRSVLLEINRVEAVDEIVSGKAGTAGEEFAAS